MMERYTVLYKDDTLRPADPPLAFTCTADDADHAEEQCLDAYPDADVVWVGGSSVMETYNDYWGC